MASFKTRSHAAHGALRQRAVFFSTVAAGALCFVLRPAAAGPDACTIAANVATCSGNQSGGIDAGDDFDPAAVNTLAINNLTHDIGGDISAAGDGIRWAVGSGVPTNPINIISNTGSFSIRATANGMNLFDNNGQSITVNHTGNIFAGAEGIHALAINGGPTVAGTISVSMVGNIVSENDGISAASIMQSGNGDASAVTVNHTGNITVNDGDAISATSEVAAGNGNSGNVTVESNGNFNDSIEARSSVFGNGNSGFVDLRHQGLSGGISAESLVGGNGNSGAVTISNNGTVSGRIFAHSTVGGIGDAAAVSITNAGNVSTTSTTDKVISAISSAGTDGDAGSVTVTTNGNLTGRFGGIEAISAAAGNGVSGGVVVSHTGQIATINGAGIQAHSSAVAGNANLVTVISQGNISTSGAAAINATSTSGDGTSGAVSVTSTGNLATSGTAIIASSLSSNGNSGNVTVATTGNMSSSVAGIIATSTSTAGTAGNLNITSSGNILASSSAIFARSIGGAGNGNIQITVNSGMLQGATAVAIDGGLANLLTVGSNVMLIGTSTTITGTTGDETINNSGIVTGNVALGAGNNLFNNFSGGTFNAGTIVDLGALGVFENAGTFAPGGAGTAPVTTTLTGKFDQGADGVFAVDVANGAADRVNVSDTASLAGRVMATVRGLISSVQQFTILSAAGGTTNNGITVQDTAVFDYELLFPNANDMVLAVTANFTPNGVALTPNQRVTAAHLQSALLAGGGNLGGLFGYLGGFANSASYAAALDRLHPEPYLAPVQSTLLANLGFTDGLMSCPTLAQSDANTFVAEGQCAWARVGARQLDFDRTAENIGFRDKAWGGSAGVQFALAPDWFGSIALGYDRSDIKVDDRASASGDLLHVGAGAKYIHGNWQISAALAGGHASYDVARSAVMPGTNALGNLSLNFLSGRLRTAYVFGTDSSYVKPMVDLDLIGMRRGGLQESGAGPAGLAVQAQTDVLFSVAPAVEIGGRFAYANNSILQPFLRAGVRLFSEDDLKATASFIGSPADVPAFTVTTPLDQWMAEMSAGLEMLSNDRFDARLSYEGRFGENVTQHGGSVKLRARL